MKGLEVLTNGRKPDKIIHNSKINFTGKIYGGD